MHTRLIRSEDGLLPLRDSWNALVRSRPETNVPFFSWDWFYHSWRHFGEPEGKELAVVITEDGDRLLGVLPLIRGRQQSWGISWRTLEFCNTGMTPRNTAYTTLEGGDTALFQAMRDRLFCDNNQWDMLELRNIPDGTPFQQFWRDGRVGRAIETRGLTSPYLTLAGSVDDYLALLDKKTRYNIKRRVKMFESASERHDAKVYTSPNEMKTALELSFHVRSQSWKGGFCNERYPMFFNEVFPLLAVDKEAVVVVVSLDGVPIGAALRLVKDGIYYGLGTDFDSRYKDLSPGTLAFYYLLRYMERTGGIGIDFCGDAYEYKQHYATGVRDHSTFQIFHDGWKSQFLFSAKTRWLPLLRKLLRKPQPQDVIAVVNAPHPNPLRTGVGTKGP